MTHPSRSRRKANVVRRKLATESQAPLGALVQLQRRNENAYVRAKRYPVPPLHRLSYNYAKPTQPKCYQLQSV
jgi:hypothetical protein